MPDWMPVFLVKNARRIHYAAHPDHKAALPRSPEIQGEDFLQRIGTAIKNEDGSLSVQLDALPVTGSLLITPPRTGDYFDPTTKGGR
jgi:hypothetical protein